MFTRQSLLLCYGITVTAAYVITEYIGRTMDPGHSAVIWTWIIAMLLPVGLTLLLGRRHRNALVWVWAVATALATAENYWVHATENKALMPFSYHTLWYLFGAVGFAYTAAVVHGSRRQQLYALAAVLNGAGAVALFFNHKLLDGYQFAILAVIQGVPMLLDAPMRQQQQEAKGK